MDNIANTNSNIPIKQKNVTSVEKDVLFYKISTDDLSLLDPAKRITNIKEKFINNKICFEKKLDNDNTIKIEEISKDSNYFFGSICKTDDSNDYFTKVTNKNNNETLDNDDILLNHYTYFYVDFNSLHISCIISKNIQSADKFIEIFINNNNFGDYKIIPIAKTMEEINNINCFRLSLAGVEDFEPMNKLNDLDCDIKDYKIEVKLNRIGPKFLQNIKELVKNHKTNTRIASVGNDTESFNLLTGLFSKKATIKIYSNYEEDIDTIRKLLQSELLKAI